MTTDLLYHQMLQANLVVHFFLILPDDQNHKHIKTLSNTWNIISIVCTYPLSTWSSKSICSWVTLRRSKLKFFYVLLWYVKKCCIINNVPVYQGRQVVLVVLLFLMDPNKTNKNALNVTSEVIITINKCQNQVIKNSRCTQQHTLAPFWPGSPFAPGTP